MPSVPEVDWGPRSQLIGVLYLPDGETLELVDEGPTFGFGRYLDEAD